jgi:hypothetical protein
MPVAASVACSDNQGGAVSLAFSTRSLATSSVTQAGDSTRVVRGNDTLIIKSVELVLREIELKRVEALANCPISSSPGTDDDSCEEVTVGVQLLALPLGNQTEQVISANVTAGIYDEVEFEIHKPEDLRDAAFIAAHPAFANISMRVTGTLSRSGTRTNFVFTSDLNEDQEVVLNPPVDLAADGAVNLTIRLDLSTWFLTSGGAGIVDPASANKGGANENLVRDNIKRSIAAFNDRDRDGLDDDSGEDDDHGTSHDSP